MSDDPSPYTPPSAELTDTSSDAGRARSIREEFLKHEAAIRSVGLLYYLAAVSGLVGGIAILVGNLSGETSVALGAQAIVYVGLGAGMLLLGRGVRQLRTWVKIPVAILSAIGLIGFPVGTLINGYILYLVFGKKGKMVFSSEYRDIIEQTPDIKYRTSIVIWILLLLIVALVIAAVVIPMFSGS